MKNIDEAIKHAEEKAKELYCKADKDFFFDGDWGKKYHCTECAKEHEQLANWLKELKMLSWIPVKTRELTAKEKEEHPDCTFMWDCPLPDDAQDVLITTIWGDVQPCTFCVDDMGSYFDEVDWDFVLAWMPLPEPYKKEETT